MDAGELVLYGVMTAGAVASGIIVGGYVVIAWAGQFVDEALGEVEKTALRLLTNPTTQKLARAAETMSKSGGNDLFQMAKGVWSWLTGK